MKDLVSPPELPQPKANKHLIALVTKKLVTKANIDVSGIFTSVRVRSIDSDRAGRDSVQMGRSIEGHLDANIYTVSVAVQLDATATIGR